ncbi:substrate-binding domain-containing protein [Rhodococcus sp. NPDC003318]|uniref:substrate-binding domain-containing protein n=1 Tax=Rhodococcus sp. NPDC003318 TaxID=3364503 RepID=UPI00369E1848
MGRHRDEAGRRGISKGPVIAVGCVIVLVLAVLGWFQLRDRISDQGVAAAQTCVEGDAVLDVAADPDIATAVRTIADHYNETAPVIRDHCVRVSVTDASSESVGAALAGADGGQWAGPGPAPALWIPQSSVSLARLADTPGVVSGVPRSVAWSPVVLAVPDALRDGLTRAGIGWQDLARLQTDPESLPALGLPGWRTLGLALPPASDTTGLAGQAVTAAVTGAGTGPVTVAQAESQAATRQLTALGLGSRALGDVPPTAAEALTALAAQDNPSSGAFHAVAVTDAALTALGADNLSGYAPGGAGPVADHPAVVLGAGWVDETRSRAAAQFAEFLRAPEQSEVLTAAGFTTGAPDGSLAGADPAAANAVLTPLTAPATPRAATVLLDVSASMTQSDGSGTRLGNVSTALTEQLATAPDDSEVGLWLYSRGLDGVRPYRIAVPTGPLSQTRDRIDSALDSVRAGTATSTYPSVITAYDAAVSDYVAGRTNTILLVTDGPNDDYSLTSSQFLRAIAAASDPARPVRVDVIAIGENSDAATLQQLVDRTGGTMTTVPNAAGPELQQALATTLG